MGEVRRQTRPDHLPSFSSRTDWRPGLWSLRLIYTNLALKKLLRHCICQVPVATSDEGLQDGPPQHPLIGALSGLPEVLLSPL